MAQKKIHIVWQNGRTIDICLENNSAAEFYYRCIKHLQHVHLNFNARQNPLHAKQLTLDEVKNQLLVATKQVGLDVDISQFDNQAYLNKLHKIYFDQIQLPKCDSTWSNVHDAVHLLEEFNHNGSYRHSIWFDYEQAAGPLVKKFDRTLLQYATTDLTLGMCSLRERELGKNPWIYKQHNESSNPIVMYEQSKPWVFLKPSMDVCIENIDAYKNFQETQEQEFNEWFSTYRAGWCAHWKIPDWTPQEMFVSIPIGHIDDINQLIDCFSNLDYPQRLAL